MSSPIYITVSGSAGSGKTTIATLIQKYLRAVGFRVQLELTDNGMPPCPTELHKRMVALVQNDTLLVVDEKQRPRESA